MNTLRYSLDGCTCLFRGEGNQNLVVALKEKELVIRFRKEAKETSYDHQELEKRYLLESQYQFLIMAPLIKEYISLPLIINLPHAQVDELNTSLLICRSESRKHKEIKSNIAEIYPDYTVSFNHFQRNLLETAMSVEDSSQPKIRDYIQQLFCKSSKTFINNLLEESHLGQGVTRMVTRMFNILNGKPIPISSKEEVVFCFEIKPKQAWFPPSDRKFHKCTYCMQQYLKLKEKKIDEISNYCPLDLFSGDLKRMEYAVKNLLQSPQNNFKIFKDGMLLFGSDINNEDYISLLKEFFSYNSDNLEDEDRLISEFCYFISSALLSQVENLDEYMKEITSTTFERSFRCNIDPKLIENINENFAPCNRKFDYLPKCCILNRLLEMQMLDREGIEASYECYLSHKYSDFSYVEKVFSSSVIEDRMIQFPPLSIAECYAISAAAKDCSIFVTVKMSENESAVDGNWRIFDSEVFNRTFRYIISVADIGPKTVSTVANHWKRNADIHSACLHFSLFHKPNLTR